MSPSSVGPTPARRVLVIDHGAATGAQLIDALSRAGYEIERESEGQSVLERLEREPLPELVLLAVDSKESLERERSGRLAHVDRLASLGTMAAGLGHEINNHLTSLLCSLGAAERELASPAESLSEETLAEVRAYVRDALGGAERIQRIAQSIRIFGGSERRPATVLELCPVLDTAAGIALSEIQQRAQLVKEYAELPLVRGDATGLTQMVVNLLVNAAQAIEAGAPERNEVRIRAWADDAGRAVIEIRDTGVGIPAELHTRIFDPFFTTKPPETGTGLGLFICRSIVEAHHGSIEFYAHPERGTVFKVTLPPAAAEG